MTSTDIRLLQLNVEGLTRVKRDLIRHLADINHVNIILLQETHCTEEEKLAIEGYNIIDFIPSKHHGIASYTCDGVTAKPIQKSTDDSSIEWITIDVDVCTIVNIYKPPPSTATQRNLPSVTGPAIVCGDFNSRNTAWGYPETNSNGQSVACWADRLGLHLLYDAKDHPSFFSGRHKKWSNPDLSFVPNVSAHNCERIVLDKFPKSGHCPIIIGTNTSVKIKSLNKKRWNFRKANWDKFTSLTDTLSQDLPPPTGKSEAYSAFTTMLSTAAKSSIPRGRRSQYIPCWDDECEVALKEQNAASDSEKPEKSEILLNILGEKRRVRWEETIDSIDFTHSSRKAWTTINRLTGRSSKPKPCPVSANAIASVLVDNGKWKDRSEDAKAHNRKVNRDIKEALSNQPAASNLSGPITTEQLMDAILTLKNGKAPGIDMVHSEFLSNMGLQAIAWLRLFLSNCIDTLTIPAVWRKAKVVAILKPKKPSDDAKSYRPISLLCMTFKLMERIILARINDIVELHLPHAQAGFRRGRSTTDQVSRLVHDIEAAFQRKEKFGTVLIDLTAAYDTVWHRGLYLKLLNLIPDVKLVKFIMTLLQNRSFYVETSSGDRSRRRNLRNGLPQGSVLAPILFNIYTYDIPPTASGQYIYADDTALGFAGKTYEEIQLSLEPDLLTMCRYFQQWHLKLSEPKTICSIFHLANRLAGKKLVIKLHGAALRFEPTPTYLGVMLDRSLTFGPHLQMVAVKASKRVNLIRKLAGSNWGAGFTTLRTSTLALVYSAAEYAAPVWSHSRHTSTVNIVLNDALRLISGTMAPTPTAMLPILAGIPPADIRRDHLVLRHAEKAHQHNSLVPSIPDNAPPQRIRRDHFATRANMLHSCAPLSPAWVQERWKEEWERAKSDFHDYIDAPVSKPTGCNLARQSWVRLNRLRTGWGNTRSFLAQIGASVSDTCVCGSPQTVNHILQACPIFSPPRGKIGLQALDEDTIRWLRGT